MVLDGGGAPRAKRSLAEDTARLPPFEAAELDLASVSAVATYGAQLLPILDDGVAAYQRFVF